MFHDTPGRSTEAEPADWESYRLKEYIFFKILPPPAYGDFCIWIQDISREDAEEDRNTYINIQHLDASELDVHGHQALMLGRRSYFYCYLQVSDDTMVKITIRSLLEPDDTTAAINRFLDSFSFTD